jgi:hypothetical protein
MVVLVNQLPPVEPVSDSPTPIDPIMSEPKPSKLISSPKESAPPPPAQQQIPVGEPVSTNGGYKVNGAGVRIISIRIGDSF